MDSKLWIVYGSAGEYSDRSEWPVAVVNDEDDAKFCVTMLQQRYLSIPRAMLDERWDHEEEIKAIMSPLDPAFQTDYTGTSYFYSSAPHRNRLDLERLRERFPASSEGALKP